MQRTQLVVLEDLKVGGASALAFAWLAFALSLGAGSASTETFDLAGFDAPNGSRQTGPEAVGFSESTPTTFVTYAVYKSAASSGDPARDFQDE